VSATLAAAVLATTMRLVASHTYAEGAPPGFSGGFKEETCHGCHFHAEPNSGGGRVTIDGLPARFAAGERYTLTVTLTKAGMRRAGFQLAARFKDGGAQAGTLAAPSGEAERVGVESQSGVQYAGHKQAGSSVSGADTARWTIEWTAPDGSGPVILHVAANAADGNERADGDVVYTTTAESAPLPKLLDADAQGLRLFLEQRMACRHFDERGCLGFVAEAGVASSRVECGLRTPVLRDFDLLRQGSSAAHLVELACVRCLHEASLPTYIVGRCSKAFG
jgi:hypothetical protein